MKQYTVIYLILIAIVIAGCTADSWEVILPNDPTRVSFSVSITEGYPTSQIKTRGTPQVGSTAYENEKITILAFDQTSADGAKKDFKTVLSKSSNGWTSDPQKAYDGLTYNFYAYASDMDEIGTTKNDNGLYISSTTEESPVPTMTYEVPLDVTKQPDMLIGNKVENKSSGQVELSMYHALSCVGFVATSKHTGNIRKVKSVTLKNVYGKGTTSLDKKSDETIKWTTEGNPDVTFSAGMKDNQVLDDKLDDITNNLTYLMNGNGYLMMIPQDLPEGARIVVEIWDGSTSSIHTIDYEIPPTKWEPGKKYMYYFDEPILEGVATYYERYADGTLGLYYFDDMTVEDNLKDNSPIIDAGYGLLVPASTYTQYPSIYLGLATAGDEPKDKSTSDGSVAATLSVFGAVDCVLYSLSQNLYPYKRGSTSRRGFQPYYTETAMQIEAGISETGSGKPISTKGFFLPHFAKGVYTTAATPADYVIRTPIQMRNISYQTGDGGGQTLDKTYSQYFQTLDFAIRRDRTVYGNDVSATSFYKESIVIGEFGGTYSHSTGNAVIEGLIINTPVNHEHHTALFETVGSKGKIKKVETAASCIYVCASTIGNQYFAGIVAENNGLVEGCTNSASITNNSNSEMAIGGVVGLNSYRVIRSSNLGVINNLSNNPNSMTGGLVAWNEKTQPWAGINSEDIKGIFRSLQFGDYGQGMEANYPGALISECTNKARVIGVAQTGGITAYNNYGGVVYACENNGDIRNNGKLTNGIMMGGIVGLQQCGEVNDPGTNPTRNDPPKFFSTIQSCRNTGNITATSGVFGTANRLAVGGIVGNNDFAVATDGNESPDDGYEIEAYGRVNQCEVRNARISGYYSDTGGIAGLNSGSVNRSLCIDVYVGGVFGNGGLNQRNSAGGIVGTNNNYVGNCLFTHTLNSSSPISSAPVWDNSSSAGGIVGINNGPSTPLKSASGYVQKCIFAAIAPVNTPVAGEIGTFAPIAGWTGGYLFRDWKNVPHMKESSVDVDATTGATPIYTIDDNFYASGTGVNPVNGNTHFANEPNLDIAIGAFTTGRYPYGQNRLSNDSKELLPLAGWYGSNWETGSRPPVPVGYTPTYSLPSQGGMPHILSGVVQAIKTQRETGTPGDAEFISPVMQVASGIRVSLNYMSPGELVNVNSIKCDLSKVTFLPNNAGGKGFVFFRAPDGWKFDATQTNPKPYKMIITKEENGTVTKTYYYCMVTENTGKIVKMVPGP